MWSPASLYVSASYYWLHEWDLIAGTRLAWHGVHLLYKYLVVCSSVHASAGTSHHHECVKPKDLPPVHGIGLASLLLAGGSLFLMCKGIASACRYLVEINQLQSTPQGFPSFIQPRFFTIKQGL